MSRHLLAPDAAFLAAVFCAVVALSPAASNGQTDCNTNGIPDSDDIAEGESADCNTNVVPDECEFGDCSAPGADWDNGGVDGADGLANQIGGVAPAQVADNYIGGAADTAIDIMTFSDVEDTTYAWDGGVQIATYENNGSGTPQETAYGLQLLSGGDIGRVQNGTLFGRPLWEYTLDADVVAPGAGTHWVSAMPSSGGSSGQAFWLTSAVPSNFPTSYFRSTFFGFPTWTPVANVYGLDLDFAFTLTFRACRDCNSNNTLDVCDIADGISLDCDDDDVPDECQDCNTNAQGDACDILSGSSTDCNTNAVPDECDLAFGTAADCNSNDLPDECDADCNTNDIVDACEIADGLAPDCDTNQTPDECDSDCQGDGVADVCELSSGSALDCNTNQVPDECDSGGAETIWNNGPYDGVDGLANRDGGTAPAAVADDFISAGAVTIITATFTDVEDTTYVWNGEVRTDVWPNQSGAPAESPFSEQIISGSDVVRVQEGTLFGRPKYDYTLALDLDVPSAGVHWFTAMPRSSGSSGAAFWLTSHVPAVFGTSYFRSSFYGFPTWTPTTNIYGVNLDFAFTLGLAVGGDCNTNGQLDICDIADGLGLDCDTNDVPDECQILDTDCNTNGDVDACDIAGGISVGDCNSNAVPDECEDCNTNDLADACDAAAGSSADCNTSGVPDECEVAAATTPDCDMDGVPDECQPDCNTNEAPDICDLASGESNDCNTTGVPDECESDCNTSGLADECDLEDGAPDCNTNGVPDECDLASPASADCNTNLLPDECEPGALPDCNTNGAFDDCDVPNGSSQDCNLNGVVDECDSTFGTSNDCNTNLVPDECETSSGEIGVVWDNGAPDETNGLRNGQGGVADAQGADDFVVDSVTRIVAATFTDVEDTVYVWNGTLIMSLYHTDGEGPAEAPADEVVVEPASRIQNGTLFGRPRWEYGLKDLDVFVSTPGQSWINIRPDSDGTSGAAFWLTSSVPSVFGTAYFRSSFFGFPTWTPLQNVMGEDWGLAFTLTFGGNDCNSNGQLDVCDIADGDSLDCNLDEVPDECQDCNTNGEADPCDLTGGNSADCNTNDIPDECDIASGESSDCDGEGTPDECEPDCNTNNIADACDISEGTSTDSDGDGAPDECAVSPCTTCPGDTNGDNMVDGDDVDGFIGCVTAGDGCACTDMDGDGSTADADWPDDLAAFVEALLSGPPPCP